MGEGKTTFIKRYIKNKRVFVFDVNNEYKELPTDTNRKQSRLIDLEHEKFINICLDKRNTVCVCEDATGFVEGRLSATYRKVMVSKRHTGNVNIVVFHSILSVPPRIIQLSDYVVLFKTNDELLQVEKRFVQLVKPFISLQRKPQYSYETIKL